MYSSLWNILQNILRKVLQNVVSLNCSNIPLKNYSFNLNQNILTIFLLDSYKIIEITEKS